MQKIASLYIFGTYVHGNKLHSIGFLFLCHAFSFVTIIISTFRLMHGKSQTTDDDSHSSKEKLEQLHIRGSEINQSETSS